MITHRHRHIIVPASAEGGDRVIRRDVRVKRNEPFPTITFMSRIVPVKKLQDHIDDKHPEMWCPIDLWWYRLIGIMRDGWFSHVNFEEVRKVTHTCSNLT